MMNKILNMKGQKGAAAVEFAIVLPVLVMLLFGIIEFSILLYDKAVITNASREGARAGICFNGLSASEITGDNGVVDKYCADNLITFGSLTDITTEASGVGGASGTPCTVTVKYNYGFLVLPNFISELTGGINLTAQTVMRNE